MIAPDGPRRAIPPGLPSLFLDSLQVTVLAAGEEINSIPAEARARIDIRLLPSTDTDAYLAGVREALGKEIETRVLLAAPPSEPTPASGPLWERLVAALADEAPVIPIFLAGITDSRYFRERGVAAYGFSPFWVEAEPMRGVHGPDERIPLDAFDRGVERMRRVVESLLPPPEPHPHPNARCHPLFAGRKVPAVLRPEGASRFSAGRCRPEGASHFAPAPVGRCQRFVRRGAWCRSLCMSGRGAGICGGGRLAWRGGRPEWPAPSRRWWSSTLPW